MSYDQNIQVCFIKLRLKYVLLSKCDQGMFYDLSIMKESFMFKVYFMIKVWSKYVLISKYDQSKFMMEL